MKNLTIYTDGSHLKHTTGRLGIGGVLINEDTDQLIEEFSEEVSLSYLEKNFGTSDVSNPTCEMLATLWALKKFRNNIGKSDNVCMKADYSGVQHFIFLGDWRIKAPYIKKIKEEIDKEIKSQNLKGRIHFEWVKGHQSIMSREAKWNNYVDKLAKGQI